MLKDEQESFFQNYKFIILFIVIVLVLLSTGYATGILSLGGQATQPSDEIDETESTLPVVQPLEIAPDTQFIPSPVQTPGTPFIPSPVQVPGPSPAPQFIPSPGPRFTPSPVQTPGTPFIPSPGPQFIPSPGPPFIPSPGPRFTPSPGPRFTPSLVPPFTPSPVSSPPPISMQKNITVWNGTRINYTNVRYIRLSRTQNPYNDATICLSGIAIGVGTELSYLNASDCILTLHPSGTGSIENLFDSNPNTWVCTTNSPGAYIEIDLKTPRQLNRLMFYSSDDYERAKQFVGVRINLLDNVRIDRLDYNPFSSAPNNNSLSPNPIHIPFSNVYEVYFRYHGLTYSNVIPTNITGRYVIVKRVVANNIINQIFLRQIRIWGLNPSTAGATGTVLTEYKSPMITASMSEQPVHFYGAGAILDTSNTCRPAALTGSLPQNSVFSDGPGTGVGTSIKSQYIMVDLGSEKPIKQIFIKLKCSVSGGDFTDWDFNHMGHLIGTEVQILGENNEIKWRQRITERASEYTFT